MTDNSRPTPSFLEQKAWKEAANDEANDGSRADDSVVQNGFILVPAKLGLKDCGRVSVAYESEGTMKGANSPASSKRNAVRLIDL